MLINILNYNKNYSFDNKNINYSNKYYLYLDKLINLLNNNNYDCRIIENYKNIDKNSNIIIVCIENDISRFIEINQIKELQNNHINKKIILYTNTSKNFINYSHYFHNIFYTSKYPKLYNKKYIHLNFDFFKKNSSSFDFPIKIVIFGTYNEYNKIKDSIENNINNNILYYKLSFCKNKSFILSNDKYCNCIIDLDKIDNITNNISIVFTLNYRYKFIEEELIKKKFLQKNCVFVGQNNYFKSNNFIKIKSDYVIPWNNLMQSINNIYEKIKKNDNSCENKILKLIDEKIILNSSKINTKINYNSSNYNEIYTKNNIHHVSPKYMNDKEHLHSQVHAIEQVEKSNVYLNEKLEKKYEKNKIKYNRKHKRNILQSKI